ncbi:hypothetical protein [Azospirillum griseum]|uniref:Uncharacterized protein n=1 Tax=Azospirillum griseum TaxID=2496639 RepID=A0A3S0K644_9PROT|nr:hypothetical protein [Azospirillum griseum]RTR21887.1 hypothetical protein EJ903_07125 [Azospirillum griseum]
MTGFADRRAPPANRRKRLGKPGSRAYTAAIMARMLFLRDIASDVHLRCCACGHSGVLPRTMLERRFGPNYPVLSIAPHYRCSRCDSRDTESRPMQAQAAALETDDSADPSFDASLSALNGLLASIRGEDAPPAPRRADPPPERPAFTPAPFPLPEFATLLDDPGQDDPGQDDAGSDWDLGSRAPLDALPPEEEADPFDAPPPPRKPVSPSARPLEELVADGPADDADPLWEPVSLADMASRQGAAAPPPEEGDDDEDWAPPPPRRTTTRASSDEDETLAAMRRFFAESDRADEDEDDRAFTPAPRNPERLDPERLGRHAPPDLDDLPLELDEEDAVSDAEPVFSHKAFVRQDFEDDPEDEDAFADGHAMDRDSTDGGLKDPARRWADHLDEEDEEEPTDAEILAFAIRDPEIRSPAPPPPPPPAPIKAKTERSPRRAASTAADGDEDGGFDKTLAALRSMIEDAAVEPKPSARRKAKPTPPPDPALDDPGEDPSGADGLDDAPPPRRSTGKASAKPSASKGGNSKQSAQEREIEEAMKALRDLVEDDEDAPPPVAPPAPAKAAPARRPPNHSSDRPLSRPTWEEEDDDFDAPIPPPQSRPTPARTPDPLPLMEAPDPPPRPAAKDTAPKDTVPPKDTAPKDSPLSKTIAALRGMLELDGRKKR